MWSEVEDTLWTDGSRLEDGIVGCGVIWKEDGGSWQGKSFYLGRDAELRAIYEAMTRFSNEVTPGCRYTVFPDAQVAIQRCASDFSGPGQYQAPLIIQKARIITNARSTIDIRWVPAYKGIPGNEKPTNMPKPVPNYDASHWACRQLFTNMELCASQMPSCREEEQGDK
jgi:ribonuclease HI